MMRLSRVAAWFGGVCAILMGASGGAFAYSQEQQDACTPDAMRLCSAYIPDVDRITACMIQNKTQLTPRCAVYFQPPMRAGLAPARVRKPQSLKPRQASTGTVKPRKPIARTVSRAER
uniref:Uncharacterized protein n=1 Tax=Rhodopseudomonas palustris (strain BisA53) TaxID=316055 RepID=Q07JJ0_RHOP5